MEIPPQLRLRITHFLAELDKDLQSAPELENGLKMETHRLQILSTELVSEIDLLRPHCVDSEDASGKLFAKETRLREVNSKLTELREQIDGLKPVTLAGAGTLLEEIVRHYMIHLPRKIREAVRFISTDTVEIQITIQGSGAMRVVRQLRGWAAWIDQEKGASSYAGEVRAVCDRVLRGQIHLGEDFPEYTVDSAALPAAPNQNMEVHP